MEDLLPLRHFSYAVSFETHTSETQPYHDPAATETIEPPETKNSALGNR